MVWYLTREEEDSWRSQDSCRIPRDEEDPRRGQRVTAHRTRPDGGADADHACSTGESRGHRLADGRRTAALGMAWPRRIITEHYLSIVYNKCKSAHIRCLLCAPDHSD